MTNVTLETQNDAVIFLNDMPHRSKEWKWWSLNDVLRTVFQLDLHVLNLFTRRLDAENYQSMELLAFITIS